MVALIQENIEPRLNAAVAPLRVEIERLRKSLTLVAEQAERVRLGEEPDAALALTDDPEASLNLATVKLSQEERYPYSTIDIASAITGTPSTTRVAMVIGQLGLKSTSEYWCEMKVGSTVFNRYSRPALARVKEAFSDPAKHLPADSPAFRTVMNFLEGL
jgi:hypothetical protein